MLTSKQIKTFGITPESHPETWALLQPATENPFNLEPDVELTENAAPQGWAAIEADDEPTVPMQPLLWSDPEIVYLHEEIAQLEDRIDRNLSMLEQGLERLQSEVDRRIDSQQFELERLSDNLQALEDQLDAKAIVPFAFRPHRLVESLRITAVLSLAIGAIVFVGAGLSGTSEQKDDLALSGVVLATAGVFAATVGYNLD
ncbi:hypothetical protein IFO70_33245 [Phormidium tenue FACHB-886]|nr:hypothetical protein [Phormidium tenue FACHB-886]